MARVAVLSGAAILDTSWLLELYRVPGNYKASRTESVRGRTADFVERGYELFVTVPVLFEVASHITRVGSGARRRELGEQLLDDVRSSLDRDSPWTVTKIGPEILLRSEDILRLAERFLESSGPNYSFADISIIDLAAELRRPGRSVHILAFDEQLRSYSEDSSV